MATKIRIGSKVHYRTEKGEAGIGVVHGIRTYEKSSGMIEAMSYLVDTGADVYNHRQYFVNRKTKEKTHSDFRQPHTVEVPAAFINPV